jgi:polysaccharide pyruvyl transferase WcaK-like protein
VLACLEHLADRTSCHVLFFPQLYGAVHSDVPFHRYLGGRLPAGVSWEIVDPTLDSDRQRSLFGLTDFCVASRYHPQIFATSHGIPGLFIWYEHKQLGYLARLGLEHYLFDIRDLDVSAMKRAIDDLLVHRESITTRVRGRLPELQALSRRTTELLVDLVCGRELPVPSSDREIREHVQI